MSEHQAPQHSGKEAKKQAQQPESGGRSMAPPALQLMASQSPAALAPVAAPMQRKAATNPRFNENSDLNNAATNSDMLQLGDSGMGVNILQQGLIDAGYDVVGGVTGSFDANTEAAVLAFQKASKVKQDGVVGKNTMKKLTALHNKHETVTDIAQGVDPKDRLAGTRALNADETKAVEAARSTAPTTTSGAAKVFVDKVGGKTFEERITKRMDETIAWMYKDALKMEKLHKDKKNLHDKGDIEQVADASKAQVDGVFSGYYDTSSKPSFRFPTNLADAWASEDAAMSGDPTYEDAVVKDLSGYFINNYMDDILDKHGADPDRSAEKKICKKVRKAAETASRDKFILIQKSWPGLADAGEVSIQIIKSSSKKKNRDFMWKTFATMIHEYIHTLEHPNHENYRQGLPENGGDLTYREGMCDYFTKMVWKQVTFDEPLRSTVEGPFHETKVKHSVPANGYYGSVEQAERVAGIVGVRNVMGAFFLGETKLIGG